MDLIGAACFQLPSASALTEPSVIWHSLLRDGWQVRAGYVGAGGYLPEEMSGKFNWPLSFTWISAHGYYPPCVHPQKYNQQFCIHGSSRTHSTVSQTQINLLTLMMLLTLMRKGTCSWRQLTMLIMEISHWYSSNKPSCWWRSLHFTPVF